MVEETGQAGRDADQGVARGDGVYEGSQSQINSEEYWEFYTEKEMNNEEVDNVDRVSESEDGVDNSDMEGDNEEEEEEYEIQEGNPSTIRVRGQAEIDILRNNML